MKVLPREVPSLYGSFPVELHPELEGFVPSADLDKARNRAAQERAAALPSNSAFSLEQWRWALSVSKPSASLRCSPASGITLKHAFRRLT